MNKHISFHFYWVQMPALNFALLIKFRLRKLWLFIETPLEAGAATAHRYSLSSASNGKSEKNMLEVRAKQKAKFLWLRPSIITEYLVGDLTLIDKQIVYILFVFRKSPRQTSDYYNMGINRIAPPHDLMDCETGSLAKQLLAMKLV